MINILVSLIPAFLLLAVLLYFDSFRLVRANLLLLCMGWGIASAALSFLLNTLLFRSLHMNFTTYSGFLAPVVEELLKCALLWLLIRKSRTGFMIDAAIYGFAIGAAFSLAENIFYLYRAGTQETGLLTWIIRGFGTAVMHSGTVAIFGILCMSALQRQVRPAVATFAGLFTAILIHALYNGVPVPPLIPALAVLTIVPIAILTLFKAGERSIRNWLDLEFDAEAGMLRMIRKGQFSETKTGAFLVALRRHFPAEMVVDLYCFITLYLELSMKAKTRMMLRELDLVAPEDPELMPKISELKALERRIGRGGFLAIAPVLRMSRKDLWKITLLDNP